MLKKAVLFYNPKSGGQNVQGKLDYIVKKFILNDTVLNIVPIGKGTSEIQDQIFSSDNFDYDYIIVSGGDGTVNQFVNKMFKNNIKVPIGIIPSGTCNDFTKCLSIPQTLDKCIDTILKGKTLKVDVGKSSNGRYFLDTFAGGLFVGVSINTPSVYKRRFGPLAYYVNGLSELKNLDPFHITVQTEDSTFEGNILLFLVLNGNHGAGFDNLIKNADLTDGIMDMILIKECTYIDLANMFIKQLNGTLTTDPNVVHIPLKKCNIIGDNTITLTMDGEECDPLPMSIEVQNKALEVFVP